MLEKRLEPENQQFRWMLELFPKSVSEFPLFFDDDDLKCLDGSPLQEYI